MGRSDRDDDGFLNEMVGQPAPDQVLRWSNPDPYKLGTSPYAIGDSGAGKPKASLFQRPSISASSGANRPGHMGTKSPGFDQAEFDVSEEWYSHELRRQGVHAPRIMSDADFKVASKMFGAHSESFGDIAQVRKSKKGYDTFLLLDGQEIQEIKSKDNSTPELRFRYDSVGQPHARMLMEWLEKDGQLIDYEKISLTGSPDGVRNMKAALQEEHARRVGVIQELLSNKYMGVIPKLNDEKDSGRISDGSLPLAQAKAQAKMDLIETIHDKIFGSENELPDNVTISKIYNMLVRSGPASKNDKISKEPDWNKIAEIIGLVPSSSQQNTGFVPPQPNPTRPRPTA